MTGLHAVATVAGVDLVLRLPVRFCAVRYFTDFIDADGLSRDEDGLEFVDRQDAFLAASEALVEAAHDLLRVGPNRPPHWRSDGLSLRAQVRDERGRIVFRAGLTLDMDWLAPDA